MASELTTQITALAADNGYDLNNTELVRGVTAAYTAQFRVPRPVRPGQPHRSPVDVHRLGSARADSSGDRWLVDIAPMLNDSSLKQTLGNLDLDVPQTLTVPITVPESSALRPGQLRPLSTWGPWVSVGACVLTGIFALLTLAAARSRGKALAALGVSALLVGAAGWAGLEVGRRYIDDALNRTTGEIRQVADVMVNQAEVSLHHWLNLTLAAGGVLVVLGIIVSMLGWPAQEPNRVLAMPFVTDIVGPQRPVQTSAPLVTGALRRTSTIDTHPAEAGPLRRRLEGA